VAPYEVAAQGNSVAASANASVRIGKEREADPFRGADMPLAGRGESNIRALSAYGASEERSSDQPGS
jgi:hypothetical protein